MPKHPDQDAYPCIIILHPNFSVASDENFPSIMLQHAASHRGLSARVGLSPKIRIMFSSPRHVALLARPAQPPCH